MNITCVVPNYLYAVDDIFPEELVKSINTIDWNQRDFKRLVIGHGHRRQILHNSLVDQPIDDYCFNTIKPQIQAECQVRFTQATNRSFTYWLDEPGFRPAMHTDGDLPSALQIYLQADDRLDLGTVFYRTNDRSDVVHIFESRPNTGYIMFNQPEPGRPELWHDMSRTVPTGPARLCLYITFGNYERQ